MFLLLTYSPGTWEPGSARRTKGVITLALRENKRAFSRDIFQDCTTLPRLLEGITQSCSNMVEECTHRSLT